MIVYLNMKFMISCRNYDALKPFSLWELQFRSDAEHIKLPTSVAYITLLLAKAEFWNLLEVFYSI